MNLRRKGGVKPGGMVWRVGGAGERAGGTLTPTMCGKGVDKLAPLSSHSWGGKEEEKGGHGREEEGCGKEEEKEEEGEGGGGGKREGGRG